MHSSGRLTHSIEAHLTCPYCEQESDAELFMDWEVYEAAWMCPKCNEYVQEGPQWFSGADV